MIRFSCTSCERPFKVADEYAGKAVRCPGCKGALRVPEEEIESDVEVVEEEEPAPRPRPKTSPVKTGSDSIARRKPRLASSEDDEDEAPRRRKARLASFGDDEDEASRRHNRRDEDDEEDETPRRRSQREDDDDEDERPRRKRRRRRQEADSTNSTLFMLLSGGLSLLFVVLLIAGWFHKGGAIVMLVFGVVPAAIGTWWIMAIAKEESYMQYLACMYVPFYDTWFSFTRWGQTWAACLMVWIGRVFAAAGIILLVMHMLRGGFRTHDTPMSPGEVDAECQRLLSARDATEARAWLGVPGRRIDGVAVGRLHLRQAVEGLYQQGAVKVTFAEMHLDEDGDDPMHMVVELPAEKEKRQALFDFVNRQLLDRGMVREADRGQKYLLLPTD
ncbi:MAG: hypothetical protein U0840_02640 [Gemmataceae bacterium]